MYLERASRILPVYTADVSGVCSALYELGGMVVIHDPSGCNSTYNTHDETRWYDRDSLIFISGLKEIDAVLGNDDKFTADVIDTARRLHPAFIALASSPLPYMNGTDFPALARLIESETGIPTFFVATNGMHDYTVGAGAAFLELAKKRLRPAEKGTGVNILGATPLDFCREDTMASLRTLLTENGFSVCSCWAMGSRLEELDCAPSAGVNLVVSVTGLAAAKYMRESFGIPYVAGLPVPGLCERVLQCLRTSLQDGQNRLAWADVTSASAEERPAVFLGEPVQMRSLAAAYTLRTGHAAKVLCPLESGGSLLLPGDEVIDGEAACEQALSGAALVYADPFYRYAVPEGCELRGIPHLAFSGRNYRKQAINLITEELPWE